MGAWRQIVVRRVRSAPTQLAQPVSDPGRRRQEADARALHPPVRVGGFHAARAFPFAPSAGDLLLDRRFPTLTFVPGLVLLELAAQAIAVEKEYGENCDGDGEQA